MASKQEMIMVQNAILDTLLELSSTTGPSPRSGIYLKVGMNLTIADRVQGLMTDEGWITATSDTIRITDKGRKLVESALARA